MKLDGIELAPKGVARVWLTFYSYPNSIYEVGVRYAETDPEQKLTIIPSVGLSKEEVSKIHKMVPRLVGEGAPAEVGAPDLGVIPLPQSE